MHVIRRTEVFAKWVEALADLKGRARVLARIERLASGHPGDSRPVGEGVSELRIDYGPGYRVYFLRTEGVVMSCLLEVTRARRLVTSGPQFDWLEISEDNMVKTQTSKYDVSEHLRTTEEMVAYFEACLEEAPDDAAFIAKALGDIARAKGMSSVARDSGLSRESLYKALSGERSPDFATILRVMSALGLRLHARAQP